MKDSIQFFGVGLLIILSLLLALAMLSAALSPKTTTSGWWVAIILITVTSFAIILVISPSIVNRLSKRFYAKRTPSTFYIAGPPIKDPLRFFGRQTDIEKITGLLINNFVMLTGPRRIGKTSLLHQLAYHLSALKDNSEIFLPILVNVEGVTETEFFHTVMEEIVNATQKYLSIEVIENLSFDLANLVYSARDFSRDLQTILKSLQTAATKPIRLVLLLDEMDTLNTYSLETQSQLRRIFQRFTHTNFSVAVAGVNLHQQWAGESSPFYNMFVPVALTPFPEAEARRLITEPVMGQYSYTEAAIARILEASLGLPHRIQQLCLETIHSRPNRFRRQKITVEEVNAVLQTIHWLDEPAPQVETTSPAGAQPVASIAEKRAEYKTTYSNSDDREPQ